MTSQERPDVTPGRLSTACQELLGADVVRVLFEAGYSSAVFGVRLDDGRQVVTKWRRWRERLVSCHQVHAHVFAAGFPCPEPLTRPVRLGELAVSVERLVPGGRPLDGGRDAAPRLAQVLAALVAAAPDPSAVGPLAPDTGFLRWDHPGRALWPPATDVAADLNDSSDELWLDACAEQVRRRLARVSGSVVVGHGDWWSDNVRWAGEDLLALAVDGVVQRRQTRMPELLVHHRHSQAGQRKGLMQLHGGHVAVMGSDGLSSVHEC